MPPILITGIECIFLIRSVLGSKKNLLLELIKNNATIKESDIKQIIRYIDTKLVIFIFVILIIKK